MDVNPREKCPLTDRRWSRAIITFQVPPKVLFKSRPHTPSRKLQNRRKLTFDLGNHFWVKTQGRNVFGSYNRNMRNGWLHFVVINSISLLELGSLKISTYRIYSMISRSPSQVAFHHKSQWKLLYLSKYIVIIDFFVLFWKVWVSLASSIQKKFRFLKIDREIHERKIFFFGKKTEKFFTSRDLSKNKYGIYIFFQATISP